VRVRRNILPIAAALAVVALLAVDANALRYQPRPAWMAGVGLGVGRGSFTEVTGAADEYRNGASPNIRFGRMLGDHFMASVNYEAWFIEFGAIPIKIRRNLQNVALGLAWFPGDQMGPLNGLFLRAGGGLGWAGTGGKEAIPGQPQHTGEFVDDWGYGLFAETGYEFWVARDFTAGLGVTANYFDLDGEYFVDTAWFTAITINLNLYF